MKFMYSLLSEMKFLELKSTPISKKRTTKSRNNISRGISKKSKTLLTTNRIKDFGLVVGFHTWS